MQRTRLCAISRKLRKANFPSPGFFLLARFLIWLCWAFPAASNGSPPSRAQTLLLCAQACARTSINSVSGQRLRRLCRLHKCHWQGSRMANGVIDLVFQPGTPPLHFFHLLVARKIYLFFNAIDCIVQLVVLLEHLAEPL